MSPSERQLIVRFRNGERGAFEEIVQRWNQDVTNLAYRMTGHLEEARDIAQQCFLRAFQARTGFEGHAALGTWLYRITVNLCRDRLRGDVARKKQLERVAHLRPRPSHRVARDSPPELSERLALIADAVAMLPEDQREVVILRHYHDLSCRAIAELLDTPLTTVKSRLSQALIRLNTRLRELNPCAS